MPGETKRDIGGKVKGGRVKNGNPHKIFCGMGVFRTLNRAREDREGMRDSTG